ncbi:MAG: DNA polymerase IV [Spirochaetales bacterium]|nr:DNA polymerase IV [Spirochaetales bacterium]
MTPLFFHVDLDAFFAAVEQLDHPEWRGRPVIVGAEPGRRGVVATCSYEARSCGVRSGMPSSQAWKLCPHGVYAPPRFDRYSEVSQMFLRELNSFSPRVHQASIDEAYLDMTGTANLFGNARQAGQLLKDRVRAATGLTISVGAAPTAYLAKIASDWQKPDGLFVLEAGQIDDFLEVLPLKKLHGCGEKTRELLASGGIRTVHDLRKTPLNVLERLVGTGQASFLSLACRGEAEYGSFQPAKSHTVSAETTFEEDTSNKEILLDALLRLAHEVMFRARSEGLKSRTPSLKLRTQDFSTHSAQKTLPSPIASMDELFMQARSLLTALWNGHTPVRLVGVGLSSLEKGEPEESPELFEDKKLKQSQVEKAVLALSQRGHTLNKARIFKKNDPRR